MAQPGDFCGEDSSGARAAAVLKRFIAVVLAVAVFAVATGAYAQEAEPAPAPGAADKAACLERFKLVEKGLEADGRYARDWIDAWLVIGTSLVVLNITQAFQVDDYRKSEAFTFAGTSLLLMIQVPFASSTTRAVQGLRNAAVVDPCLALADARNILTSNADDAAMHRNAVGYIGPILINVLSGVILGLATKHWDFAGHGSEGVSELVGIGLGELQTFTYPHGGHVKVGATSLTVSF